MASSALTVNVAGVPAVTLFGPVTTKWVATPGLTVTLICPEMDPWAACRQVTRVRVNPLPKFGETVDLHSYASADSKTRPIDLNAQPGAARQVVAQNSSRAIVDCNENVDSAIVIDVAERGAATHSQLREDGTGFISGIRETALIAPVAEQ